MFIHWSLCIYSYYYFIQAEYYVYIFSMGEVEHQLVEL